MFLLFLLFYIWEGKNYSRTTSHDEISKKCGLVVNCFSLVIMLGALVLAHSGGDQYALNDWL